VFTQCTPTQHNNKEIMSENFPKLKKDMCIVRKLKGSRVRSPHRRTLRRIIINLSKVEDNFESSKKQQMDHI
jgi:hypothetical protein